MVFNMIVVVSCIITTCSFATIMLGWNKTYLFWIMTLPMASLCSILLLNTVILYIYLKYFISPHGQRKEENFKPLRFTHKSMWPQLEKIRHKENTKVVATTSISDDPEIEAAFNSLMNLILRDFIQSWFVKITGQLKEQTFPNAVDKIIRSAATTLATRLQNTDLLFVTLNRIIPKITFHISEFRNAETSLRGKSLERSVTQSDELDLLLASRFRQGKLHRALTTAAMTTKPTEIAYLRHLIESVLPFIIDEKELASGPVRVVIREIFSNSVLQPVLDMLADPDFWNQTIDAYLGKAIIEQKMVRQLREVLNRHSTNEIDAEEVMNVFKSTDNSQSSTPATNNNNNNKRMRMGPKTQLSSAYLGTGVSTNNDWDDDPHVQQSTKKEKKKPYGFGMERKTYQDFLRMISEENNLLDLKRVRNDIVTQIRMKKAQIVDRDPEEIMDGEKVEDIIVYINRLSTAKKRVDKRIATLSGEQFDFRKSTTQLFGVKYNRKQSTSHTIGYNLRDILTNTSGLSYFMEFMDRRGDMVKLQFWLIVEGFHSTEATTQHERKTFLQDVKMVHDMYFSESAPHRLHTADQLNADIRNAIEVSEKSIADEDAFADNIRELRLRLYRIQQHVFWEIEKEHYPYFKRSDLYFKFLASAPSTAHTTSAAVPEDEYTPGRRSLDESTLYNGKTRVIQSARPASIHESLNVTTPTNHETSTDSDTSITRPSKSMSEYSRPRGHQRALSDSTKAPPSASRFQSFSNMFTTNRLWGSATEQLPTSSVSVPSSIKSREDTEDESLDEGSEPLDNGNSGRRNRLVRSNTVDAVEAELRSILDGSSQHHQDIEVKIPEEEEKKVKADPPPLPPVLKPSSSSTALLLCGAKGVKSTTAQPVQNAYALPSWTSSGGTNTISEIEHDSLDTVLPTASTKSPSSTKSTSSTKSVTAPPTTTTDDEVMPGGEASDNNIHFAPPGDLMLAAKIDQLSDEIEKLTAQEAIVDALIAKAESQNKLEELRILKKSKSMFRQELQQIQYQKSQYELQESENVLMPNRSQVNITSATIGSDKHGDFALYVIEIQQLGFDGNYASGWIVARRYSEFFSLHQKLKELYPVVKMIEFPAKWPLLKLQKPFVETRRISLERYLRRLIEDKEICKSQEFRSFLSQQNVFVPGRDTEWPFGSLFGGSSSSTQAPIQTSSSSSSLHSLSSPSVQNLQKSIAAAVAGDEKQQQGFMKHIYKTVAAGIDDILIGPSMLDLITQRLGKQVMEFSQDNNNNNELSPPRSSSSSRSNTKLGESTELNPSPEPHDLSDPLKAEGITRFTEPLCDLFIEMFELKDKTNWLRRQAVVIILQQILEGTIERKLRESLKYLSSSSMIVFYFGKITNSLWPDGGPLTFKPARKKEEKMQTREEANRKLSTWLPDLLGNMVGRQNARKGARRLFTVLQNKRLNQDLVYTLLDEFIFALFPELNGINLDKKL